MLIKISQATIPQLNFMAAKIEGWGATFSKNGSIQSGSIKNYSPCTDPKQAYNIVLMGGILCGPSTYPGEKWAACLGGVSGDFERGEFFQQGSTPLIATVRCFVNSKFGNKFEVPDGLS